MRPGNTRKRVLLRPVTFEAERAGQLKEKEVELITVRREKAWLCVSITSMDFNQAKVVLTKELADAKKREKELTQCGAHALQHSPSHPKPIRNIFLQAVGASTAAHFGAHQCQLLRRVAEEHKFLGFVSLPTPG